MPFVNVPLMDSDDSAAVNVDHITHLLPIGGGTQLWFSSGEYIRSRASVAALMLKLAEFDLNRFNAS